MNLEFSEDQKFVQKPARDFLAERAGLEVCRRAHESGDGASDRALWTGVIPGKKATLDNDLISEDKLYASVKINREVNGVKVVSKGFYLTNHVEITIYKSYDTLKSEGYNVPTGEW